MDALAATRRLPADHGSAADDGPPVILLTTHILSELGLRDRGSAMILAYETGLVRPGDA